MIEMIKSKNLLCSLIHKFTRTEDLIYQFVLYEKYWCGKLIGPQDEIFFWDGEKVLSNMVGLDWTSEKIDGKLERIGYTTRLGKKSYWEHMRKRNPILTYIDSLIASIE